jgi:hypothetical protein
MSEERMDRMESALEALVRHQHEFDMSWTGKIGELQGVLETVVEHQATFGEQQLFLEQKLIALADRQLELADKQLELHAGLQALAATVDRFVRGQGGDGEPR